MKSLVVAILTLVSTTVFTQTSLYCTIDRQEYKDVKIVDNQNNEVLFISIEENLSRTINNESGIKIINGTGHKKDNLGVRERNKKYLIDKSLDTIASYRHEYALIQINGNLYKEVETPMGWDYLNEKDEIVLKVDLTWNTVIWDYIITVNDPLKDPDLLSKAVAFRLVPLAQSKMPNNNVESLILLDIFVNVFISTIDILAHMH